MGRVAAQINALHGRQAHVDKGGVRHVVPLPSGDRRFRTNRIDASALTNILEIDPARGVCVAEPGVTFADAVAQGSRRRFSCFVCVGEGEMPAAVLAMPVELGRRGVVRVLRPSLTRQEQTLLDNAAAV